MSERLDLATRVTARSDEWSHGNPPLVIYHNLREIIREEQAREPVPPPCDMTNCPPDAALAEACKVIVSLLMDSEGCSIDAREFLAKHAAPEPEPEEPPLPAAAQTVIEFACDHALALYSASYEIAETERLIRRGIEAEQAEREQVFPDAAAIIREGLERLEILPPMSDQEWSDFCQKGRAWLADQAEREGRR